MTDPEFQQSRLKSPTGADLALYTYEAETTPRGIVQINHGLAEYAGRYAPFAAYLASRGYHTIGHDHRGHGHTEAEDGAPRRFADKDGWIKVMDDVAAVQAEARKRWPDLPLIIFGHSMGSVISMNFVMRHPDAVQGAALWNGNMALGANKLAMRIVLFFEALVGGPYTPSLTLENLTFKGWNKRFPEGRTDADWLSRDTAEVDKYAEDEICGWPSSVSLWRDFLSGVSYAEKDQNLANIPRALPFHLIGGSKDPATDNGKAVKHLAKRLKRAQFRDVRMDVLEDFRHETLMEIGREEQMAAFADWLDRITGHA